MFETIDNLSASNPPNPLPKVGSDPARLSPIQPNQPLQATQSQMQNRINPSPPENLPTGDGIQELPEDIFGANPEVSNTELKPVGTASQFLQDQGNPPNSLPTPAPLTDKSSGARKALVFFLSALVVALLFLGGYLAYKIFIVQKFSFEVQNMPLDNESETPQQSDTTTDPNTDQPIPPNEDTTAPPDTSEKDNTEEIPLPDNTAPPAEEEEIITEPAPVEPPVDTDSDGLTDLEELEIGSNPRITDTDIDGLDDYSEVKIYRTNPVKRDTDDDGYDDGTEVKNGYNPLGPGKL